MNEDIFANELVDSPDKYPDSPDNTDEGNTGTVLKIIHLIPGQEEPLDVNTVTLVRDEYSLATVAQLEEKIIKFGHFGLGEFRIYWRIAKYRLYPVFNCITLTTALNTMAKSNNILYVIRKGQNFAGRTPSRNVELYTVDADDEAFILQIAPDQTVFTKFGLSTTTILDQISGGEHLPPPGYLKEASPDGKKKKGSSKGKKK